jgi:hypothetical protein
MNDNHEQLPGVSFLAELWSFARTRRKFWLLPLLIVMLLFVIYTLFYS